MDPKSLDTGIASFFIGVFVTACGWLASAFGIGKWIAKLEARIEQNEKRMDGYDKVLTRIDAYFLTKEGEPRFITYPAHDAISKNCKDQLSVEIAFMRKDNEEMKKQWEKHSDEIRKSIETICMSIHKLELRHAAEGRRRTDHITDEEEN